MTRTRLPLTIEARDPEDPKTRRIYVPERAIRGGFSEVFLAEVQTEREGEDADPERVIERVAVKVAYDELERTLLAREAAILARIARRGRARSRIVGIGAHGKVLTWRGPEGECTLIELEYLDGQTLGAWFDKNWKRGSSGDAAVRGRAERDRVPETLIVAETAVSLALQTEPLIWRAAG